jgi:hypothetical protein
VLDVRTLAHQVAKPICCRAFGTRSYEVGVDRVFGWLLGYIVVRWCSRSI